MFKHAFLGPGSYCGCLIITPVPDCDIDTDDRWGVKIMKRKGLSICRGNSLSADPY